MRFDIDFEVFVRRFVRHKFVGGEVLGQINSAQGIGNVIDMLAFFGGCTVQDGAHHIPADGFGVKGIVVPDDDAAVASQQLEGGFSVLFHALVMVVAVHENHVLLAEMWRKVKGLGVAVKLLHVVQVFAEESV